MYDPVKQMFLPDRFIKGDLPALRRGGSIRRQLRSLRCDLQPDRTEEPGVRRVRRATPIHKDSEHHFFRLGACEDFLRGWTTSGSLQLEAANKMQEWFDAGLQNWDISRDAPYFGFEIPGAPGKYFYVWLDAPVGYMASFAKYAAMHGLDFNEWWGPDSRTELVHFIGKDILYFHALFWPAMLKYSDYRLPTAIFAHGFLTVNGQKMSKSRGTFITAESYLAQNLNPEWLRYYYAAKLNGTLEDIDLNLEDFVARVNSDLVGKFINIASRCAGFIHRKFDGKLAEGVANIELIGEFQAAAHDIAGHYEARDYGRALREIMALADRANQYVADEKPWELAKRDEAVYRLHEVCTVALNLFRLLTLYLKPVLPRLAEQVEAFLNIKPLLWDDAQSLFIRRRINAYSHLMTRIDPKSIEAMVDANKDRDLARSPSRAGSSRRSASPRARSRSPKPSASTTSARSICASPASPKPPTSKARTSCCA